MLHQLDPAFNIGILKPVNGGSGLALNKFSSTIQEGFVRLTGLTTVAQAAGLVALVTLQMTMSGGDFVEIYSSFSGSNDQAAGQSKFVIAIPSGFNLGVNSVVEGAIETSKGANDPFSGAIITRVAIPASAIGVVTTFQLECQQLTGGAGALVTIDPRGTAHLGNATLLVREIKSFAG